MKRSGPTDMSRRPESLKARLDSDQYRLYDLIWMRTIASQMESAEMERTTVDITAKAGAACWNCALPAR